MRPTRSHHLTIALVIATAAASLGFTGLELAGVTAGDDAEPVVGSEHVAYHPISEGQFEEGDHTSPTVLPDDVPELELQASRVGRRAAEPTVGVTVDGTAFFAAGDFDAIGQLARTEVMRSRDGGLSWESVQPELPGVHSEPPTTLDPMVYVDDVTGRVFNLELYVGCSYLLFSDDDAETWQRNPMACGNFVNDHQTIIAGPRPPETTVPEAADLYEGRWVYYCFNRIIDSNCGRSLDGGVTWSPTPTPAFFGYDPAAGGLCGGLHGHIATDGDGRLFLPKGHCGTPWVAISEDGGDTWDRVQVSDVPATGIHLSVTADAAGTLYMVWWDDEQRPWMAVSTDHGQTWGEAMMIAPPGVEEVNFPVIEAGDAGHVALTFPGTTETDDRRPWNQYVVISTDADGDEPLFQAATANDPDTDPIHRGDCNGRCGGLWDFQDVEIAPSGELWAAAADACTLACDRVPQAGPDGVGEGVAIRQIAGPRLRTDPRCDDTSGGSGLTGDTGVETCTAVAGGG